MENALHIWIITDGKPGHINQSLGLVEALHRQHPTLTWQQIPVMSVWRSIRFAFQHKKQAPQLIISAGHRTHRSLLILSELMQIPSIVMMKPSLPLSWFDLCLIPEHDAPPIRPNIIRTIGPLNRIQPSPKEAESGLILIGGPSKHFDWQPEQLHEQIKSIIQQDQRHWTIATSRRTPEVSIHLLQSLENVTLVLASATDSNWLPRMLAKTETCWVSQDSMSMIYEALTARCHVNLLNVPTHHENRLTRGIKKLQVSGYLSASTSSIAPPTLAEADRCATIIQQRYLS